MLLFQKNMKKSGIGAVARNSEGKLMKAWARAEIKTSETLVEEVAAIRMRMQMAQEAKWREVEF